MATLTFNGTTQYTEFSTLTGGLQNVTAGAHTLVALVRRTVAGAFNDPHAISDSSLTVTHAAVKFFNTNAIQYDITRPTGGGDGLNHNSTTIWSMIAVTFDVADTPDWSAHFRDHTANAIWTHTAGGTSPGNATGPGATG
jgi:predicted membrane-bound mannosyltransferase